MNRSVLDRYTPATLAAVHAIHEPTLTGGMSFLANDVESRFRLSVEDVRRLHESLGVYLSHHDRRAQAVGKGEGGGSPIISASSTVLSTKNGHRIDPATASIASPGRFVHDPWWQPVQPRRRLA